MATLTAWKFPVLRADPRPGRRSGHWRTGRVDGSLWVSDDIINTVRSEVTPGTSALFALTSFAVFDRVEDAFKGSGATLITSNLSKEQEDELRKEFAE
jgi:uncharacterized membrane protein